ncbi:hypothetical protein EVAR_63909_1 [Eumeta japonica]|uniref:Uncharacterized protein n=1 Tax=Eumeta variegata TaxID=151549 RepID=A0A4C1ZHE5_EUMVA|nr:hypothetical protein EVAR_63909_1 [Eumeta japonica]
MYVNLDPSSVPPNATSLAQVCAHQVEHHLNAPLVRHAKSPNEEKVYALCLGTGGTALFTTLVPLRMKLEYLYDGSVTRGPGRFSNVTTNLREYRSYNLKLLRGDHRRVSPHFGFPFTVASENRFFAVCGQNYGQRFQTIRLLYDSRPSYAAVGVQLQRMHQFRCSIDGASASAYELHIF